MTDSARRLARTVLQVLLGLAAGAPLLAHTTGLTGTLPGLGVVLGVAAAITRLMASPLVDQLLPSWLRAATPAAAVAPALLAPVPAPPTMLAPPAADGTTPGAGGTA